MTTTDRRRDPQTGAWLHGYALKRWVDARETFLRKLDRLDVKGAATLNSVSAALAKHKWMD